MLLIMNNLRKNHPFLDVGEDARRQYIDALSTFSAWEQARKTAAELRGGMYWKTQNNTDYLIRTSTTNAQKSLGKRSEETETIYHKFMDRKSQATSELKQLELTLMRHQRMNRALYVGRAPETLIQILNVIYSAGLSEYFTVVGTHALYAYESAAGVRIIQSEALATQDVDLLWDARKRVKFLSCLKRSESSMLGLLKKADSSFKLRTDQRYTAVNSKGFEVDILRREAIEKDPHPLKLSDDDDDFYVVQAQKAGILLNKPPFSQMIVASNGSMARMRTIDPSTFVAFKRWLSQKNDRDSLKRGRDALQANIVEQLIIEYLPQYQDTTF